MFDNAAAAATIAALSLPRVKHVIVERMPASPDEAFLEVIVTLLNGLTMVESLSVDTPCGYFLRHLFEAISERESLRHLHLACASPTDVNITGAMTLPSLRTLHHHGHHPHALHALTVLQLESYTTQALKAHWHCMSAAVTACCQPRAILFALMSARRRPPPST